MKILVAGKGGREHALVIALDLSRSMDAQDLVPSRLTRARLKILDILERRASGPPERMRMP